MAIIGDREPFGTRESQMMSALSALWEPDAEMPVIKTASRVPDSTGLCPSDSVITRAELAEALKRLSLRQYLLLRIRIAENEPPIHAAKRMHTDRDNLLSEETAALQLLIRYVFADFDAGGPPYEGDPHWRRKKVKRAV